MKNGDKEIFLSDIKPGLCIHQWPEVMEEFEVVFLVKKVLKSSENEVRVICDLIKHIFVREDFIPTSDELDSINSSGEYKIENDVEFVIEKIHYLTEVDIDTFRLLFKLFKLDCEIDDGGIVDSTVSEVFQDPLDINKFIQDLANEDKLSEETQESV